LQQKRFTEIEVIVIIDGDCVIPEGIINSRCRVARLLPASGGRSGLVRNEGIRLAQYDWIAFLDDDDAWFPNKLEQQFELLEIDATQMICSAALEVPGLELPVIEETSLKKGLVFTRDQIAQRNLIVCSSVVVRTQLLRELGGFGDLKYASDWKLWLACLDHIGTCSYIPQPLVFVNASPTDLDRATVRADIAHAVNELFRSKVVENENSLSSIANTKTTISSSSSSSETKDPHHHIAALVSDFSGAF